MNERRFCSALAGTIPVKGVCKDTYCMVFMDLQMVSA